MQSAVVNGNRNNRAPAAKVHRDWNHCCCTTVVASDVYTESLTCAEGCIMEVFSHPRVKYFRSRAN